MKAKIITRALALMVTLLLSGVAFAAQPSAALSFDNVQVFATTSTPKAYSFQFAAYNLTGNLVASTQTSYPAAAFELPPGNYLLTVSATSSDGRLGYACPLKGGGVPQGPLATSVSAQTNKSSSAPIIPWCYPPSSEYGYATATVSGPQTINIRTQNASTLPTVPVTVKVSYVDGAPAADASVYASIVGEWYFWWGPNSPAVMSAQTGSDGIAHLVLPAAPAVITAWKWIPVLDGSNKSTIQTTVGGQEINVTMYWEPTFIGLSGSGLLLPPQNSISITLQYQQPDHWVLPGGVASKGAYSGGAPAGTVASQPSGIPALASNEESQNSGQYLPSQIPPIQQDATNGPQTGNQAGFPSPYALAVAAIIFTGAALAVILAATRHHAHKPPFPIG